MPRPLLLAALLLATGGATAADYVQAPGSSLVFAGTYQGQVFQGHFPGFGTTLSFDPAAPERARLAVDIPLADVTTDNADYDGEMRGPSFFDTTKFPRARYRAEGFRALGDGRYEAEGVLELHGVSQPVTLAFTWSDGERPTLAGRATVKRLDFGIGAGMWADTSLIPDEIAISTRVVFRPAP